MESKWERWVHRAFLVGLATLGIIVFSIVVDAIFIILRDGKGILNEYPTTQLIGRFGYYVFLTCTFILWLRSWQVVFPGKITPSGFKPLLWFLALTLGFLITPWYVHYRELKANAA
jgi:hypothetical protein